MTCNIPRKRYVHFKIFIKYPRTGVAASAVPRLSTWRRIVGLSLYLGSSFAWVVWIAPPKRSLVGPGSTLCEASLLLLISYMSFPEHASYSSVAISSLPACAKSKADQVFSLQKMALLKGWFALRFWWRIFISLCWMMVTQIKIRALSSYHGRNSHVWLFAQLTYLVHTFFLTRSPKIFRVFPKPLVTDKFFQSWSR